MFSICFLYVEQDCIQLEDLSDKLIDFDFGKPTFFSLEIYVFKNNIYDINLRSGSEVHDIDMNLGYWCI